MPIISVSELPAVARTLLIPLAYRAIESQRPDAILKDEQACYLADQFDEDFTGFGKKLDMEQIAVMMRARQFDRYAQAFLGQNPAGTVVDIGCGLDTRFYRLDNGQMHWVGLDLPEVIAVRRTLLPETPCNRLIGGSALDFTWMDEIPPPAIFLAEGVLPYFSETEVKGLTLKLCEKFPGAEFVFDVISNLSILVHRFNPAIRKAAAQIRWGLDRSEELVTWGPGIQLLEEWRYFDHNEPRLGSYNLIRYFPPFLNMNRVVRLRLGQSKPI